MKLLFICTGNICRSPTAEGIVKHICSINNLKNLKCDSAALYDYHTGEPPDIRSIEIAKKYNINIENLKARRINKKDFNNFDIIIGMDKNHIKVLNKLNFNKTKIELYLNFTQSFKNQDVPDPYYGKTEDFKKTFDLINIGAKEIVTKFGY